MQEVDKMKKLFLAIALMFAASFPVFAGMKHEHSMPMSRMEDMKHQMDTLETKADEFDLSLDIMTHKDYQKMMKVMKMGPMKASSETTHHIAVSISKDNKKVDDAVVNMKVISPDGKEETHVLTYNPDMMYQYVGHFNMPKKGKYQALILFKTGEEKHQGGVYYEVK